MTPQGVKILVLIILTICSQSSLHAWRKEHFPEGNKDSILRRNYFNDAAGKFIVSCLAFVYSLIFMLCEFKNEKVLTYHLSFMSMFISASILVLTLILTYAIFKFEVNEIIISILANAFNIFIITEIKDIIDNPPEKEENLASSCSLFQIKIGTAFAILYLSEYLGEILFYTEFFEERLLLHMFIGFTLVRLIIQIEICKQRPANYKARESKIVEQLMNCKNVIGTLFLSLWILCIISLGIFTNDSYFLRCLYWFQKRQNLSLEQCRLMLSVFGLATYMTLNELKKIWLSNCIT